MRVRRGAFGRWDERAAAPPPLPRPLPPLSPPLPSSPPAPGRRRGAPIAGRGSVCAPERPEPGAPAFPASLLPPAPRPGRPGPSCGEAEPPRRHCWTGRRVPGFSVGASDPRPDLGLRELPGAPDSRGGPGPWGGGRSTAMRAGPRAPFVFQVTGPPPLPSAWAARRYRRPEAPRGGTARPPRAPSLRLGVAPTPPALPSALPSLILPMLG